MIKLDIGCGHFPRDGFVGLDIVNDDRVIYCNLEQDDLPFDSWTVSEAVADNVLEHITNLIPLMNEINRVMMMGGLFTAIVPLANTVGSLKDPTHVRQFVLESFDYFDAAWDYPRQPDYGIKKWKILSKEVGGDSPEYQYITVVMEKI